MFVALGLMVAMALFDTLVSSPMTNPGALDLVWGLGLAFCAFAWVKADARERNIDAPAGSALLAALIIPVGVPIYLFRALGLRRGLFGSLKALGFMAIAVLTYLAIAAGVEVLGWSAHVA